MRRCPQGHCGTGRRLHAVIPSRPRRCTGRALRDEADPLPTNMTSTTKRSFRAAPIARRAFGGLALLAIVMVPQMARAATALVRWMPRSSSGVTGYKIYVRNGGAPYSSTPQWTGNPTAAADGTMSATVTYTPACSGANYFTVVAAGGALESGLSGELPVGDPNPCRYDACTTKTSCNFATRADGTPCDDGVFCNGPEICVGGTCDASSARDCSDGVACSVDTCSEEQGRCLHTGPPGCCPACDTSDPCLADACAQGDCSAPPGADIEFSRIKLMDKANGIKMVAKGRFTLDPSVDPTATGVTLEFRTIDGAVLYHASIAGPLFNVGATGGRYRYTASRVASDSQSNGITRLDFRIKNGRWLVTIMADTDSLVDAAAQGSLIASLRVGDSCFRQMDMACERRADLSLCR
jgi:hypothetical protein